MLVTKKSQISGKEHTLDLPTVTEERLARCWDQNKGGSEHIQDVFPELNADEREFLKTGITAEEWAEMFGDEDE